VSNVLFLDILTDGNTIHSNILAIFFSFLDEERIYALFNMKEEELIKAFCGKLKNKNFIRIIVYEEKKLFLLRMKILKYNVYCRNFGELDNPLTTNFLEKYFNDEKFENICRFFEIEVNEEEKMLEKLLSQEYIKKDAENRVYALKQLYSKLKKYCL
jgi:hypothetical protein